MIKINNWLKGEDIDTFPILGYDTFNTFIKLCETIKSSLLLDNGLSNRSESFKIWVSWNRDKSYNEILSIIDRYKSMKLMSHYLKLNILENDQIGFYIKLNFENKNWNINYGITNNKKLYKIGEFIWNITVKMPDNEILKYFKSEIDDFNPRQQYLLFLVKKTIYKFNPGVCVRLDPYLLNNECIVSCQNLIIKTDNIENEANIWLNIFKNWVSEQEWWNNVILKVKIRKDNWIDFIIITK